jgi:hypothetical protein
MSLTTLTNLMHYLKLAMIMLMLMMTSVQQISANCYEMVGLAGDPQQHLKLNSVVSVAVLVLMMFASSTVAKIQKKHSDVQLMEMIMK